VKPLGAAPPPPPRPRPTPPAIPAPIFEALQATGAKADAARAEATAARLEIQGLALQVADTDRKLSDRIIELGASAKLETLKAIVAIFVAALGVIGTVLATRSHDAPPAAAATAPSQHR
jgi:hypothetical protein